MHIGIDKSSGVTCSLDELVRLTARAGRGGGGVVIWGLEGGSKPIFLSLLARELSPLLVITPNQDEAEALYNDVIFFTASASREGLLLFSAPEFPSGEIPPLGFISEQMRVLRLIAEGKGSLVITPVKGLFTTVTRKEALLNAIVRVRVGEHLDRESLVYDCVANGYSRVDLVEERGELCLRGAIMDIYPIDHDCPYRIEFFGDEVISLRTFDVETQRSIKNVDEITITPLLNEGDATLLSYLPPSTPFIIDSPLEVEHEALQQNEVMKYGLIRLFSLTP